MKKIVVIDDTQMNLTLISHWIKKMPNYEAISFLEPQKALEFCLNTPPELIIIDYMMPEMNGLEFIAAFREKYVKAEIPILMVTANDQKDIRYESLEVGANDFLTKPIDKTEFSLRVETMLTLRDNYVKLADQTQWLEYKVRKAIKTVLEREQEIIYRLAKAAEYRDPETGGHIKRMARYSQHIAKNLGLSVKEQDLMLEVAPMHDIGKVGIPDGILLKEGKLTPLEFELMKEHAQMGCDILSGSDSDLLQMGAVVAQTHHEKFNGKGYPSALVGEAIPIFSRIIAVADVFDALTSVRPYKHAWKIEDAIKLLKDESGEHFDPKCVEAFLQNWDAVLAIKDNFKDE